MYDYTPIIIVSITFALLWVIGLYLTQKQKNDAGPSVAEKIRGTMVTPGLSVIGLNENNITELRTLLNTGDEKNLSVFIALKKPTFVELENYINSLRMQFTQLLNKPIQQATEIEKITAANHVELINPPRGYDFESLNKTELRLLLEHDTKKRRNINQEFITKFGDTDFIRNFETYAEISGETPVTLLVARGEKYREQLEIFVQTGIALQGRKIPLQDRLSVLKFSQLREMGQELKLTTEFKRRSEATQALAEIPGAAILLAMQINVDDTFMIKPESVDIKAVQNEWSVISTCAKLLCTKRNRQ